MAKVSSLPLRGQFKTEIYHRYITSCIRFDLTVYDACPSVIGSMDRLVRTHLRKWSRMPPSTHLALASHSWGLNLEFPSNIYERGHATQLMQSNKDPILDRAITESIKYNSSKSDTVLDLVNNAQNPKDVRNLSNALRDSRSEQFAAKATKQG